MITKHRTQCNTPPVGHPCPPVALVKFYQRRALFCFLFFDMVSQKTIIRSLLKVAVRFNPVTFPPVKPFCFCHYFCFGCGKIRPPKNMPEITNSPCPPMHHIFSRLKRYDFNRVVFSHENIYIIVCKT